MLRRWFVNPHYSSAGSDHCSGCSSGNDGRSTRSRFRCKDRRYRDAHKVPGTLEPRR